MKNIKKIISLLLSLCSITLYPAGGDNLMAYSADISHSTEHFNVRVTKDSFTDFSESLILPNSSQLLYLDKLFFSNTNVKKGTVTNLDILSLDNHKFVPKYTKSQPVKEKKQIQAEKPPNIYNISLSASRNNKYLSSTSNQLASSGHAYESIAQNNVPAVENINPQQLLEESKNMINNGKLSQAEALLDKAVFKTSDNSWVLAEIAEVFETIKKYDKAIKTYEKAISLTPNRMELLYSYSLCLYKNNMLDNAETNLSRITVINPEFMLAYYNLGNIYYKKGNYYEALNAFKKAIQLNPLSADAYFNLALTLEVLNYKNLAFKYYNKCLELKPKDLQAQKALERLSKA